MPKNMQEEDCRSLWGMTVKTPSNMASTALVLFFYFLFFTVKDPLTF